uniref:Uncharacterized protein n=1 Tax=Lotharella globosa TaxID=91324 RepID=A0A7S3Z704_9EUKA
MTAEKERVELPPQRVIKAVEKTSGPITAPDLAVSSGSSLYEAHRALVNLASLTGAEIQVSKEGDLVYQFPSGVRGVLIKRSVKQRLIETWGSTWPVALYITRVAFGIMLFASITAITISLATLSTMQQAASGEDDRDREYSDGPRFFGGPSFYYFHLGPSPFDFFRYDYMYNNPYQRQVTVSTRRTNKWRQTEYYEGVKKNDEPEYVYEIDGVQYEEEKRMGILPAIFSYVFGDGVPQGLDQDRLQMCAEKIRQCGGAVVAEQIAPYVENPRKTPDNEVDGADIMPILQALNGYPEVTEGGTIVYVFPDLQVTARSRYYTSDPPPSYFIEPKLRFSLASGGEKWTAGFLCVLNLVLALFLKNAFKRYDYLGIALPGFLGTMQALQPYLLIYAISLNLIPLVRALVVRARNNAVDDRNDKRRWWASRIRDSPEVRQKIQESRDYVQNMKTISKKDIIYTTDEDVDVQTGGKENEFGDFDARLGVSKTA